MGPMGKEWSDLPKMLSPRGSASSCGGQLDGVLEVFAGGELARERRVGTRVSGWLGLSPC